MDERDCIHLAKKAKPFLVRFLNYTSFVPCSHYRWNAKQERIEFRKEKQNKFVLLSLIIHLVHIILQIAFTITSQISFNEKLLAFTLISISVPLLTIRWEFDPDEISMEMLNRMMSKVLVGKHCK